MRVTYRSRFASRKLLSPAQHLFIAFVTLCAFLMATQIPAHANVIHAMGSAESTPKKQKEIQDEKCDNAFMTDLRRVMDSLDEVGTSKTVRSNWIGGSSRVSASGGVDYFLEDYFNPEVTLDPSRYSAREWLASLITHLEEYFSKVNVCRPHRMALRKWAVDFTLKKFKLENFLTSDGGNGNYLEKILTDKNFRNTLKGILEEEIAWLKKDNRYALVTVPSAKEWVDNITIDRPRTDSELRKEGLGYAANATINAAISQFGGKIGDAAAKALTKPIGKVAAKVTGEGLAQLTTMVTVSTFNSAYVAAVPPGTLDPLAAEAAGSSSIPFIGDIRAIYTELKNEIPDAWTLFSSVLNLMCTPFYLNPSPDPISRSAALACAAIQIVVGVLHAAGVPTKVLVEALAWLPALQTIKATVYYYVALKGYNEAWKLASAQQKQTCWGVRQQNLLDAARLWNDVHDDAAVDGRPVYGDGIHDQIGFRAGPIGISELAKDKYQHRLKYFTQPAGFDYTAVKCPAVPYTPPRWGDYFYNW